MLFGDGELILWIEFFLIIVTLEVISIILTWRLLRNRKIWLKYMVEESRVKGVFVSHTIVLWVKPIVILVVAAGVIIGVVGIIEHPEVYGNGVENLEILWILFVAAPIVLLLAYPWRKMERVILLNNENIDIVSSPQKGTISIITMPWNKIKVNVGMAVRITIPNYHIDFVGPYYNRVHLNAYLLKKIPEGILKEPDRRNLERDAKLSSKYPPILPS
jgi:hypothetical protein